MCEAMLPDVLRTLHAQFDFLKVSAVESALNSTSKKGQPDSY